MCTHQLSAEDALEVASAIAEDQEGEARLLSEPVDPSKHSDPFFPVELSLPDLNALSGLGSLWLCNDDLLCLLELCPVLPFAVLILERELCRARDLLCVLLVQLFGLLDAGCARGLPRDLRDGRDASCGRVRRRLARHVAGLAHGQRDVAAAARNVCAEQRLVRQRLGAVPRRVIPCCLVDVEFGEV